MFRHSVLTVVLCMLMLGAVYTTDAQAEPFTWEPYDFTITPPDEWEVQTTASELILSEFSAEDSPFISVRVVTPKALPPDMDVDVLSGYAPARRVAVDDVTYGDNTWPTVIDEMILGGRQIGMALVADTFIVSWSATVEDWETLQPTFNDTIATISATPVIYTPQELLTQRLTWRSLSFDAPADWIFAYAGQDNHIIVTSQESRMFFGATFSFGPLTLDVFDLSAVRLHVTPATLADVSLFVARPDSIDPDMITTEIDGDLLISSAPLATDAGSVGQALLIVSPDSAFVVAGIAGEEQWQATERALFEAILGTLTIE